MYLFGMWESMVDNVQYVGINQGCMMKGSPLTTSAHTQEIELDNVDFRNNRDLELKFCSFEERRRKLFSKNGGVE